MRILQIKIVGEGVEDYQALVEKIDTVLRKPPARVRKKAVKKRLKKKPP